MCESDFKNERKYPGTSRSYSKSASGMGTTLENKQKDDAQPPPSRKQSKLAALASAALATAAALVGRKAGLIPVDIRVAEARAGQLLLLVSSGGSDRVTGGAPVVANKKTPTIPVTIWKRVVSPCECV